MFYAQSASTVISGRRETETHREEGEADRPTDRQTGKHTDRHTDRQRHRERETKLVFYAQSTSTVISGRRERGRDGERGGMGERESK